jgi:5'-nucleotidase
MPGLCWTRQSVREYNGWVVPGTDPMGRQHYWFAAKPLIDTEENTDRWAVDNNFVALTPLRINLTDEAWLEQMLAYEAAKMGVSVSDPVREYRGELTGVFDLIQ